MTTLLLMCVALGSLAGPPSNEPLPIELKSLMTLFDDEERLVDAVRAFDREQQTLIAWDYGLAKQHEMAKEEKLAQDKVAQARRRIRLIERAYQEVLVRYPNNARANTYFGELCYDNLKEIEKALACWRLAVRLDSSFAPAQNNLGLHYCHGGEIEKGIRYLEEAAKLSPDHPDYRFNLAQIYMTYSKDLMRIKKWDMPRLFREAMVHSKKACELSPDDYSLLMDYATNFFAAERFEAKVNWRDAAQAWERAREKADNQTDVFFCWLNEGRAWVFGENDKEAERCLREALTIYPDSKAAQRLLESLGEPKKSQAAR